MNKIAKTVVGVIATMFLLGFAGRCDYNEQVIYNMSDDTYRIMKEQLSNPSDTEVVDEYLKNREYWDSLVFDCTYK